MALNDTEENAALVEKILGRKWEDLEAEEHAGYLLFPEMLLQRVKGGTFKEHPIMLRVPREHERRRARVQARGWAKEEGIDPEMDTDLFDNMDTMCQLVTAIRNTSEPFEPYEPDPKRLERVFDRPCLDRLWGLIEAYQKVLDPRPHNLNEAETAAIIAVIAKSRNIVPLAALDGQSQVSLIVTMAKQLSTSATRKS